MVGAISTSTTPPSFLQHFSITPIDRVIVVPSFKGLQNFADSIGYQVHEIDFASSSRFLSSVPSLTEFHRRFVYLLGTRGWGSLELSVGAPKRRFLSRRNQVEAIDESKKKWKEWKKNSFSEKKEMQSRRRKPLGRRRGRAFVTSDRPLGFLFCFCLFFFWLWKFVEETKKKKETNSSIIVCQWNRLGMKRKTENRQVGRHD